MADTVKLLLSIRGPKYGIKMITLAEKFFAKNNLREINKQLITLPNFRP